jgi:PGF-CTERM protein
MKQTIQTVGLVLVVLCSSVVGGIALGGSAAALDAGAGSMYPSAPGTDALGTTVVVARPGDAVAQNGIRTITLSTSAGSFENVTDDDVFIAIRGGQRIEIAEGGSDITELSNISVSPSAGGNQLQITLPRPVRPRFASDSPNTGAEVAVKFENFTTPSQPGSYQINGTLTDPSGATDGPASVSYSVSSPALSMANQSLSQFSDQQTINVSAAVPGGGYVGLFTTAPNGSPGQLVGATNVSTSSSAENYSIDVGGNVSESQQLMAVAYTESSGRSAALRDQESFDPTEDQRLRVNGTLVNATANVSTLDVDGRVEAGGEYGQGARLYFPQGEPNTGYQLRSVNGSELGPAATQFETAANGTTVLDTSELSEGQYAITRVTDGSLVSLDNDSTTGPQDDSIFITGQQVTTQATTQASGTDAATDTATSGDTTETAASGGADATAASGSGNGSGSGSGNGSGTTTGSSGPGFGIAVAVVALLGAALLATRR